MIRGQTLVAGAVLAAAAFGVGRIDSATPAGAQPRGGIPDAKGLIHACYRLKSGSLRVIDQSITRCRSDEHRLSWQQKPVATPTPGPVLPAPHALRSAIGTIVWQPTSTIPGVIFSVDIPAHPFGMTWAYAVNPAINPVWKESTAPDPVLAPYGLHMIWTDGKLELVPTTSGPASATLPALTVPVAFSYDVSYQSPT